MAQRCVGDLAQRRFGVERHPQTGGGEHVHVIGAVTDGHRLRHRHAGLLREVPQRLGFSGPVDDRPDDAAGQLSVDDLEFVGRDEVHLQLVRERVDDLTEAARHDAAVISQAPQRAQGGACPGRQLDLLPDLLEHFGGQPRQRRHPSVQRLCEVQFASHGRLGDLGDRRVRADPVGQHLDDLALDQGGVDVKDDEPLGPSRQAVILERDIDALGDGDLRQRFLQLSVDRARRHRDPQLQTRYGIVGDAADEVDVDAERGDLAGHHAERLRSDRAAEHDDRVGRRFPHHRHVVAALDRHVETDTVDGRLDLVAQRGPASDLRRADDQHSQRQPAADDDLFDVEQLDLVPRQHLEQRRGHTRLIVSGDGDQHRHLGHAHPRLPPVNHQVRIARRPPVTSPSSGPCDRPTWASARIRSTMCG